VLDGIGQFIEGSRVVPQAGGSGLRHLEQGALVRSEGVGWCHRNL
jgi:hypothetical protein